MFLLASGASRHSAGIGLPRGAALGRFRGSHDGRPRVLPGHLIGLVLSGLSTAMMAIPGNAGSAGRRRREQRLGSTQAPVRPVPRVAQAQGRFCVGRKAARSRTGAARRHLHETRMAAGDPGTPGVRKLLSRIFVQAATASSVRSPKCEGLPRRLRRRPAQETASCGRTADAGGRGSEERRVRRPIDGRHLGVRDRETLSLVGPTYDATVENLIMAPRPGSAGGALAARANAITYLPSPRRFAGDHPRRRIEERRHSVTVAAPRRPERLEPHLRQGAEAAADVVRATRPSASAPTR